MTIVLPKPIRQLLALALLFGLIFGVASVTAMPAWDYFQQLRTQIEQERLVLGHLKAAGAQSNSAHASGPTVTASDTSRLTLTGDSDSIRAANLQSIVGEIAAASGIQMRSLRTLPAREQGDLRMLGVQIQFLGTIEQLQKAILAIEVHQPYLFVGAMQITPLPGAVLAGSETPGLLDARMDVLAPTARPKG